MCGGATSARGGAGQIGDRALWLLSLHRVIGQHIEPLLDSLAGSLLHPVSSLSMQGPPFGARQRLVGHVTNQVVLKGVLTVVQEARTRLATEEVFELERLEHFVQVAGHPNRSEPADPKH